ncbi:hypothetical protein [Desulfocastanea catecholica]
MLRDLAGGHAFLAQKPTVVIDAAIATEDNVAWLRQQQYPYLVVTRKKHREFDEESSVVVKKYNKVMVRIGRLRKKYSRASKQYTISVEKDETTGNATKITWQQKAM